MAAIARADAARVEMATVDGVLVYHWRPFKSVMADDVDRALVLREFQRKSFKIPPKLVNEEVQRTINEKFGGDADKFAQDLRQKGTTLEEFRRFTTEEIIVQAMLYQVAGSSGDKARLQAEWLAKLRAGTTIKRLPTK